MQRHDLSEVETKCIPLIFLCAYIRNGNNEPYRETHRTPTFRIPHSPYPIPFSTSAKISPSCLTASSTAVCTKAITWPA